LAEIRACVATLEADGTAVEDLAPPGQLEAVRWFATENPLSRSTERLSLPDVAAPLGYFFFASGIQLRRDFTDAELVARYGTHDGYVNAVKAASDALVAEGLWDRALGNLYVRDARDSDCAGEPVWAPRRQRGARGQLPTELQTAGTERGKRWGRAGSHP
jgi:hypothetical protein